ncbi:hypothetical protein ABIE67_004433 [Streptomyces sp. V4I8]|uniref:hypothetical protein n=1 Tax=Streptomyces sp. V4I8 TaxID=3156469 RepID=UPI0035153968
MSENQNATEPTAQPADPAQTTPEAAPPAPDAVALMEPPAAPPARKPLRRGRIATVAGSLLLAGAVVAGVGYTVVTVRDADRDAGAPVWKFPAAKADDKKSVPASGLAGMLVPYGTDGWVRGPDIGEFGSDAQLSGAHATALRKESLRDLPRSQRRQLEKQMDKRPIKGMAMRSYINTEGTGYSEDVDEDTYTVSIVLSRLESTAAVRDTSTFESEFLDALDIFRKGPKVKGHKNAKCFLPPKGTDEELESMYCTAYVGDVLVTATADGIKPLDTKGAALLLATQLDRIAERGKAI